MDNNSISISPASVADSTSVQEQVVKGSLSSSNLNECEGCLFEGDEFDLENYKYDYRTGHPAVYVGTYHKYNCGSLFGAWLDLTTFASYEDFCEVCRFLHPMNGTMKAVWTRTRLTSFCNTLTSMMTSAGRLTLTSRTRAAAGMPKCLTISVTSTLASSTARRSLRSTSQTSAGCWTRCPRASSSISIMSVSPVISLPRTTISLTMRLCSVPTKPSASQHRESRLQAAFLISSISATRFTIKSKTTPCC